MSSMINSQNENKGYSKSFSFSKLQLWSNNDSRIVQNKNRQRSVDKTLEKTSGLGQTFFSLQFLQLYDYGELFTGCK